MGTTEEILTELLGVEMELQDVQGIICFFFFFNFFDNNSHLYVWFVLVFSPGNIHAFLNFFLGILGLHEFLVTVRSKT